MKIGYARVSTDEQNLDLQLQALAAAGCETMFQDQGLSGVTAARPGLREALERAGEGDTLTVALLQKTEPGIGIAKILKKLQLHLAKAVIRWMSAKVEYGGR
jgi:hypothetical protein